MEERNGLVMDLVVSRAAGTAERDGVLVLLNGARESGLGPRTLGVTRGTTHGNV